MAIAEKEVTKVQETPYDKANKGVGKALDVIEDLLRPKFTKAIRPGIELQVRDIQVIACTNPFEASIDAWTLVGRLSEELAPLYLDGARNLFRQHENLLPESSKSQISSRLIEAGELINNTKTTTRSDDLRRAINICRVSFGDVVTAIKDDEKNREQYRKEQVSINEERRRRHLPNKAEKAQKNRERSKGGGSGKK